MGEDKTVLILREFGLISRVMAMKMIVDEQKKRTMAALERRFMAAKAEAQPQVRVKRRPEDTLSKSAPGGSSVGPSVEAPTACMLNASSKKGPLSPSKYHDLCSICTN